ncbi:MAG: Transcriptional regulator, TrmB [Candidatus Moranbacteria bacterium GW2011_GWE1_35_17]|nr:MAG: Transcriptional regulator, TrmB [Candidatus Moranbacteria bacterium GW2011_GWE1_35_17]KKP83564.1 MAG: Transcriptional regulator, TrmB [Candidatus Moranbacteria bacterium GW2011_GWF1_35_5]KKP84471.1 MAG: Transcriptional regulator, TrmB [Candidatus Moranbacteria bacterium GW2011_GWF2_35_54]
MEIKQVLAQFDLVGKKADVYLAVLELGSGSVIEIAKKAEIKRTTVYDILLDLEKIGLIYQTTKGAKRLFVAEDPEKLRDQLEEKEKMLSEMLPQLRSLYNVKGIKPKIRFYEGKEGLRQVYADTLNYEGEILAFASDDVVKTLGMEWANDYLEKRIKKEIRVRIIIPETDLIEKEFNPKDQKQLRSSKLVNPKKYPFSIEINIYGHQKVALMSSKEETGIIIEGAEIYNTMKLIFELLWDNLPEIKVK